MVALTFVDHGQAADDVVASIDADGGRARAFRLDVADPDGFAPALDAAQTFFAEAGARGLDVLVANAGIAEHAPLAEVTIEAWDRVMAVNARGVLLSVQHAAARMGDGGRIVAVSTVGTAWPSPGETVYAASKAAVEQIVRVASRELGPRGITVNTVSAGPTDTDLLRAGAPPEALAGAAAITALGRIGEPADVAGVVGLLCRPEAGWLTGATLRADGGLT